MTKAFLVLTILALSVSTYGQNNTSKWKRVFEEKTIVFYGYDFSHFKLSEAKRYGEHILPYVGEWIDYMKIRKSSKDIAKQFGKESVVINYKITDNLVRKISNSDLVATSNHSIEEDSLTFYVDEYELEESRGIGLVIFVERFKKLNNETSVYYVFFDISTREILMLDCFRNYDADGHGLTNHWGLGLRDSFNRYSNKVYRKRLKAETRG